MSTNRNIAAENERLRRIMNDRRTLGLEVMAATLALERPSLSADQVLETVANAAKAAGFNRTAGLSAAVDHVVGRDRSSAASKTQGELFEGLGGFGKGAR